MNDLEAVAALAPDPTARDWRGISFTDFVRECGVTLSKGQLALTLVAYNGLEPRDLPEELRDVARQMFGPVEVIPASARRVFVVVAGGRGGKTYIIGALRLLHLSLTVSLAPLRAGQEAFALIFSSDPRQRRECFRYAHGAALNHPGIRGMLLDRELDPEFSGSSFTLRRPDGRVTVEELPPKPGGGSGRGRWLVCALLEEAAFFQDAEHKVNDAEVFAAVTPRVLPGGQTILSSTPWAESGVLYSEFVANHPEPSRAAPHLTIAGHPHRAIAAHAPTLLLYDSELNQHTVAAEQARDPGNAAREYGAQFMPLTAVQFFDAVSIAQAVDPALANGAPRSEHSIAAVGADLGFVRDAATGCAIERTHHGYALLSYIERIPAAERLKPSEVFASLVELAQTYGADEIVADQHYAESAREAFNAGGVVLIELPGGNVGKADVFSVARNILGEGLLRLPNDPRLLQQLREVQKRPLPGGGYAIEQPRKSKGGHGDIVSALVAGIWRLSMLRLPEIPEALPEDYANREAALWQRRNDERVERSARNARLEARGLIPWEDEWG